MFLDYSVLLQIPLRTLDMYLGSSTILEMEGYCHSNYIKEREFKAIITFVHKMAWSDEEANIRFRNLNGQQFQRRVESEEMVSV